MNLYERNFIVFRDNCLGYANVDRVVGCFYDSFKPRGNARVCMSCPIDEDRVDSEAIYR